MPINVGGGDGNCLYINTKGTNVKNRLPAVAGKHQVLDALNKVYYARAHSAKQQTELLNMAPSLMDKTKYSIIIVDIATSLYR